MIKKTPFKPYKLEEERIDRADIFTIRLNKEERKRLNIAKTMLNQPKDSTALKTLSEIGFIVLHSELERLILEAVFINKRNNQRSGAFIEYPAS
jgi:hypothetical protein